VHFSPVVLRAVGGWVSVWVLPSPLGFGAQNYSLGFTPFTSYANSVDFGAAIFDLNGAADDHRKSISEKFWSAMAMAADGAGRVVMRP
jgi:hypothetical protein